MNANLIFKISVAGLAMGMILYGIYSLVGTVQPYVTFPEATVRRGTVRVAAFIDHKSRRYDPQTGLLKFVAKDTKGNACTVTLSQVPPGGFEQSPMAVLIGRMNDGHFHADRVFIKCPSKYQGIDEHGQRNANKRSGK
ncbi:MAG: cytochrome c maturation protein CcmE [Armatimonadetes bacterium]|nr:cytochrome c maturation protein CcmE [Armatimonadota bacterium]MDW8121336.1 cytochrome c maturation protein CcmE [Armatimonadota bacterium]